MPLLLAIETSQREGGVAARVIGPGAPSAPPQVEWLAATKRHDDDLLPAIDRLFDRCGWSPGDLRGGAVTVSAGPGGFTGLRIAVATAKMFAEALQARTIAVPSALVAAESVTIDDPIFIALASKNNSAWVSTLVKSDGFWKVEGQPGICTAADLSWQRVGALVGDEHVPASFRAAAEQAGVRMIEPRFDPVACLNIASRMLAVNQTIDPLMLAPLYPREPEAVTLWNQRHSGTSQR